MCIIINNLFPFRLTLFLLEITLFDNTNILNFSNALNLAVTDILRFFGACVLSPNKVVWQTRIYYREIFPLLDQKVEK